MVHWNLVLFHLDLPADDFLDIAFFVHHLYLELLRVAIGSVELVDAGWGRFHSESWEGVVGEGIVGIAWAHNLL